MLSSVMTRFFSGPILVILLAMGSAYGHGERPRALHLEFSAAHPGVVWILTDTQGLFANLKTGFSWVCEDAVYAGAATRGVAVSGDQGSRWAIATANGLFLSSDRGCSFTRAEGVVGAHDLAGLWTHRDTPVYIAASATRNARNDVFLSRDQGETWVPMGLGLAGVVKTVHWSVSDAQRLYVHHSEGLSRSEDQGATSTSVAIGVGDEMIPGGLVADLAVSPVDPDRIVAAVEVGERSRLLLSRNGGRDWENADLVAATEMRLVFRGDGAHVLAVNPFGEAWRSKDAGATWSPADPVPAALGCLRIEPGAATLYGCSNPDAGGPWVAARSDDFGLTWTPVLTRFEDAAHRDDCGADAQLSVCCRGLCPGTQTAEMCGQPDAGFLPEVCQPPPGVLIPFIDGGVTPGDAEIDAAAVADLGVPAGGDSGETTMDAGVIPLDGSVDGSVTAPQNPADPSSGCDGCFSGVNGTEEWPLLMMAFVLIFTIRPRRTPHR